MRKDQISRLSTTLLCAAILLAACHAAADSPKNIILLIGDGFGFNHALSGAYYLDGEAGSQRYEKEFHRLAMSTYSADGQGYDPDKAWTDPGYIKEEYTDSAAAATAMACGVKAHNGVLGMDIHGEPVENIVEWCEAIGKATGLITSVMFSHATPAGFVAHSKSRGEYENIANQMLRDSGLDVVMGAGHPWYDSNAQRVEAPDYQFVGGEETWKGLETGQIGADSDGDGMPDPWMLIETRPQFQQLAYSVVPKRVLGVPQVRDTLQEKRTAVDGEPKDDEPFQTPLTETVPTLAEMTAGALNLLAFDPDGFFLMIEGGAIDWSSHANDGGRTIEEVVDFFKAIDTVIDWVESQSSWDESLVIVTADHECGYLVGPDSPIPQNRGAGVMPGLEWRSGSHTNCLVPFYVKGAGSNVFRAAANRIDPVRDRYLDNTDIARVVSGLLRAPVAAR
jgi:alkaline phosphatase